MRRKHLVFFLVIIFFCWNMMMYYMLVSRNPGKSISVSEKLQWLQDDIEHQLKQNQGLLDQLRKLRDDAEKRSKATTQAVVEIDSIDPNSAVLPILMIACDRVTVSRSLDQLLKYRKNKDRFPIIVSQDCGHQPTSDVIQKYVKEAGVVHIKQPNLKNIELPWPKKKFVGYYKIARHYKWALDQVFLTMNHSAVIIVEESLLNNTAFPLNLIILLNPEYPASWWYSGITSALNVEDDLDVSPDFYEYFSATFPILHADPSLWCVSAWNDNGKNGMVSNDAELLYRTDFFPGLGWMMEKKVWNEIGPKWPETFWDDWMRHENQRKERACIRPEICRTSTFGKKGVSKGLFYEKHLKHIKLNDKYVPFTQKDLNYLKKENYDRLFAKLVYETPEVTSAEVTSGSKKHLKALRVTYTSKETFKATAKKLGIMDDFKAGVPRVAYRGVVSFMYSGQRVYLTPLKDWKQYDVKWT